MTSQQDKELDQILEYYRYNLTIAKDLSDMKVPDKILSGAKTAQNAHAQAIKALTSWKDKEVKTRETELLDSLYWMYSQYCSGGHDFMGAGETASDLLENAGYIEADGAGRITKDNGDSYEQSLQSQGGK